MTNDPVSLQAEARKLLKSIVGSWEGDCTTWLRPGEVSDESKVTGRIHEISGTSAIRHSYEASFQGEPRSGEEIIAYNPPEVEFQVSWLDSFHMNYAILFSTGPINADGDGFSVLSKYRMGPADEFWGWRTEYKRIDEDSLLITAFNISPNGEEAKAVELTYKRTE